MNIFERKNSSACLILLLSFNVALGGGHLHRSAKRKRCLIMSCFGNLMSLSWPVVLI